MAAQRWWFWFEWAQTQLEVREESRRVPPQESTQAVIYLSHRKGAPHSDAGAVRQPPVADILSKCATLFLVTISDLHNFLGVMYSLKLIALRTQGMEGQGKRNKTKRKNRKEMPHEYEVIPFFFFFSKRPHKDSSFWQECSRQKIKLQEGFCFFLSSMRKKAVRCADY